MLAATPAVGALVLNPPMTIDTRVTVQPIIVSDDDGGNTAGYFGDAAQEAAILGFIDDIWAQAGIDIAWEAPTSWSNTFANTGTPGSNDPRPVSDLSQIVSAGDAAGVGNTDPTIIDLYFVEIAAGFSSLGENFANGLARVNGNGITQHVGDNLPTFNGGREVVASVVAHEIGHNLGLNHVNIDANLMLGSPFTGDDGELLNASQIATARSSFLAEPITVVGLTSDYNDSGQVEQGDLDLVLQNWGIDTDANGVPAGWINDLPSGQIEQTELDGVLQNWGDTSIPDFGGSSVPEPAAFAVPGLLFAGRRFNRP